jgi:glyoxylase-like metal-dependent hydrolase (beta-lactamase superfamily II)
MGPGIRRFPVPVDARAPGGETHAHLVDGLLIDPAGRTDALDRAAGDADHVAVTHAHPDHVGAVAEYAARTGATVWARRGFADRFERATGVAPDRRFRDGDRVGPARAVATPGHAPDHVCFAVDGAAVVGDLAVASGSVAVAAPDGDVRAYLTSLRRLIAAGHDRLYPAHGPPIGDPDGAIRRLLAHRRERDGQVLAAVEAGAADLDAVVAAAYDADLTGVRDLARGTARAHLERLARAGRIDRAWLDWLGGGSDS